MGVAESTEISPLHREISHWEWTKAAAICREYADVDASFGIDQRTIQDLAEISEVMAKDLFNQFSPNQHKYVNAVTFLSFLIVLAAGDDKDCLTQRLEALFHLVDFSNAGSISRDDLTILLLSIETAIRIILVPSKLPDPTQCRTQMAALIEIANSIGKIKGRKLCPTIKQNEFTEFMQEFLMINLGDALCIDEVHRLLSGTGDTPEFPHDKK